MFLNIECILKEFLENAACRRPLFYSAEKRPRGLATVDQASMRGGLQCQRPCPGTRSTALEKQAKPTAMTYTYCKYPNCKRS